MERIARLLAGHTYGQPCHHAKFLMRTCLQVGSRVNCANQTEDPVCPQYVLRSALTN
jgi:hypothetical protein